MYLKHPLPVGTKIFNTSNCKEGVIKSIGLSKYRIEYQDGTQGTTEMLSCETEEMWEAFAE